MLKAVCHQQWAELWKHWGGLFRKSLWFSSLEVLENESAVPGQLWTCISWRWKLDLMTLRGFSPFRGSSVRIKSLSLFTGANLSLVWSCE